MTAPEYCKRDGVPCAFRMTFAGGYYATACGYMFFTDKQRGCEAVNCDKWADKLPERIEYESDTDEDFSNSDNCAECAGGNNVLYSQGLEEGDVLAVCSGT